MSNKEENMRLHSYSLTLLTSTLLLSHEIMIDRDLGADEREFITDLIKQTPQGFIHIKAGSFMMGSKNGYKDEMPRHRVVIKKSFYIAKTELSVGKFKKFVHATAYTTEAQNNGGCYVYNGGWKKQKDASWKNPYFQQTDENPVVCISYNDAKAYTKWLSVRRFGNYRLPTEEEWEYIARAGTKTKYSFGSSASMLNDYAWYNVNSNNKTHQVGTKKPNAWGIYDIHGNVWEWCEDWYTDSYSLASHDSTTRSKSSRKFRVLRGGSWGGGFDILRSANRFRGSPKDAGSGSGFRILRED